MNVLVIHFSRDAKALRPRTGLLTTGPLKPRVVPLTWKYTVSLGQIYIKWVSGNVVYQLNKNNYVV